MALSGYSISRDKPDEGVKRAVKELVPEFKDLDDSDIELEALSGGITNILFRVSSPKVPPRSGEIPVVVRIYGNNTEAIIDRKKELKIHTEAAKNGLGSKIYGAFKNGFAHGYIDGGFVEIEEIADPKIQDLIATEIGKWHSIKFPADLEPTLWTSMRSFASKAPTSFSNAEKNHTLEAIGVAKMKLEIDTLEATLAKLNSPIVFCHNDLLHKNIILNKAKDSVSFIDFEYASYNPRGFDLGNHFNEYAGMGPDYNLYPNKEQQYTFFKSYLKATKSPVNEENIHKLYLEANKYALASHLYWGFWALVQAENSDIDFGFLEYGAARLKQYLTVKDEFLALK